MKQFCCLLPVLQLTLANLQDAKPQGTVILERSRVADVTNETDKANSFLIVTPLRTYVVVAETPEDKASWAQAIQAQCDWATSR